LEKDHGRRKIFGCAARMSLLLSSLLCAPASPPLSFDFSSAMIFLQMVNGLRHYPVANPSRKPFRIPLFKRNWSACCAYGGAAKTEATTFSTCFIARGKYPRFRQIVR